MRSLIEPATETKAQLKSQHPGTSLTRHQERRQTEAERCGSEILSPIEMPSRNKSHRSPDQIDTVGQGESSPSETRSFPEKLHAN